MPAPRDSPRALIRYAIIGTALAVVILWSAYQAGRILLLVYVSGLLAIGFAPLVDLIERQRLLPIGTRRFPRWLAILNVYLVGLAILFALVALVAPPLVEQARDLWERLPTLLEEVQTWLMGLGLLDHRLTAEEVAEMLTRLPAGEDVVGGLLTAVWGVVGGIFGIVTILILTFYLLVGAHEISEGFVRLFPRERRPRIRHVLRVITRKVSAWLTGQLLVSGIIGLTAGVALWLMDVPYFYVLALIAALGEFIPILGPVLAAIPAVAIAWTVSLQLALAVTVFYIVQQQLESHLLVPKLMERQVGLSPIAVIVALLIGGSLLGIAGAVLAVPTAAILMVVFQELAAASES